MLISQGIDWYKVLVVGKSGKLNETIEVSALWSIQATKVHECESIGVARIRDCYTAYNRGCLFLLLDFSNNICYDFSPKLF